ncbi:glycine betaine ABC transporter substrate-binding protein [Natranaerobius trueperi]|uniref:glycine betaine ABC transporter substrate-binding protein n=1 Tax=Natranaerobius trueperi TaxID=759412 RepID=UPI001303AC4F|nr:glycine betaine ABC transporter substrate-binding protein [Natranaerobius trueperi]
MKLLVSLCLVVSLTLVTVGCGEEAGTGEESDVIAVGSKEFTEQLILGQLTVKLLEEHGYDVIDNTGLEGTSVVREALLTEDVDVKWEYTGTALITHLGYDEAITDSEQCYEVVKEEDLKENGVVWLDYAQLDNTYTLMMSEEKAQQVEIETISDLAEAINNNEDSPAGDEWTLATNQEYYTRDDGMQGVEETYGFQFDNAEQMSPGIIYGVLRDGELPVGMGFMTDGRIEGYNLVTLEDDKDFHPAYNAAPNIREEVFEEHPELEEILGKLSELLDNETMQLLNAKVDIEEYQPETVAEKFLQEEGLVSK